MPIENRINAPTRSAPRANRAPVNEYAGLGQGLQQLAQGLDNLTTTQWRLQVSNESASLDNWLTEQMGTLQIEALKKHRDPDEQLLHWQNGVKRLEQDAVQMYGKDELMQNRWQNIFENKRIPGELRMQQQMVRGIKKASLVEFNAANKNTLNAVLEGEVSVDIGDAIIQGRLNGLRGETFGPAEYVLRSREIRHSLIKIAVEKNDVAYLGNLSKSKGATAYLPKLLQGETRQAISNRQLAQSVAVNSFVGRWGNASAADKIVLANSLSQVVDGELVMVGPAFGEEHSQTLLEVSTLLVIPGAAGRKIYAELSSRTLKQITARDPRVQPDLNNAMPLLGDKLRPILDGLGRNRGTRLMQGELAEGVEKLAALLMVEDKKLNGSAALDLAIKRYFPYSSSHGVVIPTARNYSAEQQKEIDQDLNQQKRNYAEAFVKATSKYKGDAYSNRSMLAYDVGLLMDNLRWVLIGDGHQLATREGEEDKLVEHTYTALPSVRKKQSP